MKGNTQPVRSIYVARKQDIKDMWTVLDSMKTHVYYCHYCRGEMKGKCDFLKGMLTSK